MSHPVFYLSIKGEENRKIHGIVIFKILCLRKPFNNYEIITSKTTFFSFGLNWTFFYLLIPCLKLIILESIGVGDSK